MWSLSTTGAHYFLACFRPSKETTYDVCCADEEAGGADEMTVVTVVDGSADEGAALLEGGAWELEGGAALELLCGGAEEEGGSGDADDEGSGEEEGAGVSEVEGEEVGVEVGSGLSYTMSLSDKAG